MKVKLLHCGDFHLDAPFNSLSDNHGIPDKRRQELRQALCRTIELVKIEQVDILLICGDLYEHGYIRKSTLNFICEQFEKIPNVPILVIPGNHDPAVPDSFYCNSPWPSNVHILIDNNIIYNDLKTGARVYGSLPDALKSCDPAINILMLHGTLDMAFNKDACQPVSSGVLDEFGFDYCAMGHFHSRIEGAGRRKNIYNAGSPEPLGFDEEGEHGVYITTVEKSFNNESSINTVFKKISLRNYRIADVQVGGCQTDEQAAYEAMSAIENGGCKRDLYKIILKGYISHDIRLDTFNITELLKEKAFYIKVIDDTVPDYDFERIAGEPGLRGLFVKKMLEKASEGIDEEGKRLIMQALYYGMEAIDEGRVCI